MLNVYRCLVDQHDLRLVVVAAAICLLSTIVAMALLDHAAQSSGRSRVISICNAALGVGFGFWASHFIALLAYDPGVPSAQDVPMVALSLLAPMSVTGLAFYFVLGSGQGRPARFDHRGWTAGAMVGLGLVGLHYIGIAAFLLGGHKVFDPVLVSASVVVAVGASTVALPLGLSTALGPRLAGGALLAVAALGLHFVGLGAMTVVPDIRLTPLDFDDFPVKWLALPVALVSLGILGSAWSKLRGEMRERSHVLREASRMRSLADAAVEGLLICQDDKIVTANRSFLDMSGYEPPDLAAAPLSLCFSVPELHQSAARSPGRLIETVLRHREGGSIPVEVMVRQIDYGGRPHKALAVRDMRDRRAAEERIRFLAHHDALTGLANRDSLHHKLDQEIERAKTHGQRLALLCLDLDRFKQVNDLFGQSAGDTLLKQLAATVSGVLAENQMMARLDGDEFAVVMPDVPTAAAVGRLAETILEAIGRQEHGLPPGASAGASIGIAVYPNDGIDRQTMLSNAFQALTRAKAEGRGTYRFFEAGLSAEVRDRRLLEYELHDAVGRGEMRLVYQPQTLVETGEIVGFEALLRWRHPTRGDVSPAVFIPIAEDSGAIQQIGAFVLRMGCREAARWKEPLRIAINVSPVQIHAPNFTQLVHEVLLETGLKPSRLELEITETALIRDLNRALLTLRQLRALDVRIAMDDFGMGYSSLSTLRAFPFDKIKIDASFVRAVDKNEQAAAIVRAVLGLGRGLKLPILAEGVESQGELAFLLAEGCQEAQGFLIGRPSPIETFQNTIDGTAAPAEPVQSRLSKQAAA